MVGRIYGFFSKMHKKLQLKSLHVNFNCNVFRPSHNNVIKNKASANFGFDWCVIRSCSSLINSTLLHLPSCWNTSYFTIVRHQKFVSKHCSSVYNTRMVTVWNVRLFDIQFILTSRTGSLRMKLGLQVRPWSMETTSRPRWNTATTANKLNDLSK